MICGLQVASTWTESFEALLDAYSQLGEHIPLLQQYDSLFGGNSDMRRALVLVYFDILDFHQRALHFFSGKGDLRHGSCCQYLYVIHS